MTEEDIQKLEDAAQRAIQQQRTVAVMPGQLLELLRRAAPETASEA